MVLKQQEVLQGYWYFIYAKYQQLMKNVKWIRDSSFLSVLNRFLTILLFHSNICFSLANTSCCFLGYQIFMWSLRQTLKTYNHICCYTLGPEESDKCFKTEKIKKEEIQVLFVLWKYNFYVVNNFAIGGGSWIIQLLFLLTNCCLIHNALSLLINKNVTCIQCLNQFFSLICLIIMVTGAKQEAGIPLTNGRLKYCPKQKVRIIGSLYFHRGPDIFPEIMIFLPAPWEWNNAIV